MLCVEVNCTYFIVYCVLLGVPD